MLRERSKSICPNCGKLAEVGFSSSGQVKVGSGCYGSTLYGVCQLCANNHRDYMASLELSAAQGNVDGQ